MTPKAKPAPPSPVTHLQLSQTHKDRAATPAVNRMGARRRFLERVGSEQQLITGPDQRQAVAKPESWTAMFGGGKRAPRGSHDHTLHPPQSPSSKSITSPGHAHIQSSDSPPSGHPSSASFSQYFPFASTTSPGSLTLTNARENDRKSSEDLSAFSLATGARRYSLTRMIRPRGVHTNRSTDHLDTNNPSTHGDTAPDDRAEHHFSNNHRYSESSVDSKNHHPHAGSKPGRKKSFTDLLMFFDKEHEEEDDEGGGVYTANDIYANSYNALTSTSRRSMGAAAAADMTSSKKAQFATADVDGCSDNTRDGKKQHSQQSQQQQPLASRLRTMSVKYFRRPSGGNLLKNSRDERSSKNPEDLSRKGGSVTMLSDGSHSPVSSSSKSGFFFPTRTRSRSSHGQEAEVVASSSKTRGGSSGGGLMSTVWRSVQMRSTLGRSRESEVGEETVSKTRSQEEEAQQSPHAVSPGEPPLAPIQVLESSEATSRPTLLPLDEDLTLTQPVEGSEQASIMSLLQPPSPPPTTDTDLDEPAGVMSPPFKLLDTIEESPLHDSSYSPSSSFQEGASGREGGALFMSRHNQRVTDLVSVHLSRDSAGSGGSSTGSPQSRSSLLSKLFDTHEGSVVTQSTGGGGGGGGSPKRPRPKTYSNSTLADEEGVPVLSRSSSQSVLGSFVRPSSASILSLEAQRSSPGRASHRFHSPGHSATRKDEAGKGQHSPGLPKAPSEPVDEFGAKDNKGTVSTFSSLLPSSYRRPSLLSLSAKSMQPVESADSSDMGQIYGSPRPLSPASPTSSTPGSKHNSASGMMVASARSLFSTSGKKRLSGHAETDTHPTTTTTAEASGAARPKSKQVALSDAFQDNPLPKARSRAASLELVSTSPHAASALQGSSSKYLSPLPLPSHDTTDGVDAEGKPRVRSNRIVSFQNDSPSLHPTAPTASGTHTEGHEVHDGDKPPAVVETNPARICVMSVSSANGSLEATPRRRNSLIDASARVTNAIYHAIGGIHGSTSSKKSVSPTHSRENGSSPGGSRGSGGKIFPTIVNAMRRASGTSVHSVHSTHSAGGGSGEQRTGMKKKSLRFSSDEEEVEFLDGDIYLDVTEPVYATRDNLTGSRKRLISMHRSNSGAGGDGEGVYTGTHLPGSVTPYAMSRRNSTMTALTEEDGKEGEERSLTLTLPDLDTPNDYTGDGMSPHTHDTHGYTHDLNINLPLQLQNPTEFTTLQQQDQYDESNGFRYFRIVQYKSTLSSSILCCAGFEIYGKLTEELT